MVIIIYEERIEDKHTVSHIIRGVKVVGHADRADVCVAVSTVMQTVGAYLMEEGYDKAFNRSHEEVLLNALVEMTVFDESEDDLPGIMLDYLTSSLFALASQFNIKWERKQWLPRSDTEEQ